MSKELVCFLHNDLDAWGAVLNIEHKFPNVKKKYFYTNYGDIEAKTNEVQQYIKESGCKNLLISDVSFATSPVCLKQLDDLDINCTLIDHHMYPDGFFDDIKMKVIWDQTKSAALLTHEYLKNEGANTYLDQLTKLIDIYDLWQIKHEDFMLAQDLNEYFWSCGLEELRDIIIENDYNLPPDFNSKTLEIKKQYKAHIADLEQKGLIKRAGGISIIFTNEWFNQAQLLELYKGQDIIIGVMSYGIIKIRINADADLSDEFKQKLRLELTGHENTGHPLAFTYKINGNFDKMMIEVERIVKTIQKLK